MKKLFRLAADRLRPWPKIDETSPLTVFTTARELERLKEKLKPEHITTVVKAIDSLHEPRAGSTRFVVDEETFQALEALSATTKYQIIKIAANVVSINRLPK